MKIAWFRGDYILKLYVFIVQASIYGGNKLRYIPFPSRNSILFLFRNNLLTYEMANEIFQMIKLPVKLINIIVLKKCLTNIIYLSIFSPQKEFWIDIYNIYVKFHLACTSNRK